MALNLENTVDIIELMENYIESMRPPADIRDKLDINYAIDKQSVIIYEIRPAFRDPSKKIESPNAKATYVKKEDCWKVFWMRSNLKWYPYDPKPKVKTLKKFLEVVQKDEYGCFRG